MADAELRLIAGLLHANANEQQDFFIKQIPETVFHQHEREMGWIIRFRENYHRYPSARAFATKFGLACKRPSDPLSGLLDIVLERAMFGQLKKNISNLKERIDGGKMSMAAVARVYQEDATAFRMFSSTYDEANRSNSTTAERFYRERFLAKLNPDSRIIDSPWPKLNAFIPIFFAQEMMFLSGRFGMGKTWMAQFWAHYLASMRKVRVLFVSYEMSLKKMELRDESIRYHLNFQRLLDAELSPRELRNWRRDKRRLKDKPYELIMVKPKRSDDDFATLEELTHRIKPQVVIGDALYKMKAPDMKRIQNEAAQGGYISWAFKRLVEATNTFGIGIIQAGRQTEDKKGKSTASPSSAYGSDRYGQDADFLAEISGQRGSNFRRISLMKGRDRGIGDWHTNFQLDPHPDFGEHRLNVLEENDTNAPTAEFVSF